jgi:hypothetical protein
MKMDNGRYTMLVLENVSMGRKPYLPCRGGEIMKKKLIKNKKQNSLFKVALYSSETSSNKCTINSTSCNSAFLC